MKNHKFTRQRSTICYRLLVGHKGTILNIKIITRKIRLLSESSRETIWPQYNAELWAFLKEAKLRVSTGTIQIRQLKREYQGDEEIFSVISTPTNNSFSRHQFRNPEAIDKKNDNYPHSSKDNINENATINDTGSRVTGNSNNASNEISIINTNIPPIIKAPESKVGRAQKKSPHTINHICTISHDNNNNKIHETSTVLLSKSMINH